MVWLLIWLSLSCGCFSLSLLGVFLGVVKWTQFTNFITIKLVKCEELIATRGGIRQFQCSGGNVGTVTITTCLAVNGGGW